MKLETLRLSINGPVASIVMARASTANAIDGRFVRELADVCARLGDEPAVRVATLTAEGESFCAGWAPEALAEAATTPGLLWGRHGGDPFGCLAALSVPVAAALNGDAFSAGPELALACDVRIAGQGARFAVRESELGLLPLAGGGQRLPRIVGRGRALAMILTGEVLDADAAYRAGLVSKVVPDSALTAEAEAIALSIARRGPIALRYAKEAVAPGLSWKSAVPSLKASSESAASRTAADEADLGRSAMQIILEPDEAWSIMTLVVSQVLDQVDLSEEGRAALRRWRRGPNEGASPTP